MQEDYFENLLVQREKGEIDRRTEDRVKSIYLNQIRHELESNSEIRNYISGLKSPFEGKEKLIQTLKETTLIRQFPVLRPGTEDILENAVDIILSELIQLRKNSESLYLVDRDTGKLVTSITEDDIYQPSDYVGLDGEVHQASKILHPGLSAAIGMKRAQGYRLSKLEEKASQHTLGEAAIRHIKNPSYIIDKAREILSMKGIEVKNLEENPDKYIEFGREHIDEAHQSLNFSFDRANLFAQILAKKIEKETEAVGTYYIGPMEKRDNGRQRWFRVGFRAEQKFLS